MPKRTGLYYRRSDYAGFWRRVLIDAVDAVTVALLCAALAAAGAQRVAKDVLLAGWAAIFFGYFVLLKSSRFRTLGYRVGKVKIVGMDGRSPGIWPLLVRMSLMALGPLNYIFDLAWLSADPHKQALRDKLAGTYVVRSGAEPSGSGDLVYRYYDILGYNFLFCEIQAVE